MIYIKELRKLEADKNGYLAKKDLSDVYDKEIYLGIYDDQTNYIEVTEEMKLDIINNKEVKMQELFKEGL